MDEEFVVFDMSSAPIDDDDAAERRHEQEQREDAEERRRISMDTANDIGNKVIYEDEEFDWSEEAEDADVRQVVDAMLEEQARGGWRLVGVTGAVRHREWWFSRW